MIRTLGRSVLPVAALLVTCSVAVGGEKVDFRRDIRPLLSDRCMYCHGPDAHDREADLNFQDRGSVFANRDGSPVVTAGESASSAMFHRITSDDPDVVMPPPDSGKTLNAKERALLKRWIDEGADWSAHWAYEKPVSQSPPESTWSKHPIDRFLHKRLRDLKITPSKPADSVTLLRRLHFDLTGLPPAGQTPAIADYENTVDRLLKSEAFGERMAMVWLDLVRFADTVGYHGDQDHNVSPYRDWVINAFNNNMPFDDFTQAQLAGDLLENSTINDKVASCYNRLLQTSHEGGVQPKEYLAIYAADRVRNVSAVWMGGTLGCAQCHDHKYDPYTARDFYSMAAFFADIDEEQHFRVGTNSLPTRRPPEITLFTPTQKKQIGALRQALEKAGADRAARKKLEKQIAALNRQGQRCMITVAKKPREMRLLPRGNWLDDSGPVVEPGVPEFLGSVNNQGRRATRLDLANWLVNTRDGAGLLTARVMVNRFWYILFGTGLSTNLDDFGGQGQSPSYPELMDWLAIDFARDWNVRRVMKFMVMSKAYQQSSITNDSLRQRDPNNSLFARQGSFRLPAEMIRDNALVVSDLLVQKVGGTSIKPPQPAGYYRHLNFPTRKYKQHVDTRQWRRGVYVHWQRQFLHPMLKAFDAPSREECTAQRARSNTPLAALVLLNDPTFVEAARGLASRVISVAKTDNERLDHMFQIALSRRIQSEELAVLNQVLASAQSKFQSDPEAAKKLISIGDSPLPKVDPVELASWTQVARGVMNLDEFITRN